RRERRQSQADELLQPGVQRRQALGQSSIWVAGIWECPESGEVGRGPDELVQHPGRRQVEPGPGSRARIREVIRAWAGVAGPPAAFTDQSLLGIASQARKVIPEPVYREPAGHRHRFPGRLAPDTRRVAPSATYHGTIGASGPGGPGA